MGGKKSFGKKASHDDLRNSERMLRMIFDNAQDGIFINDISGKVLDINRKMLEMFQVTKEQVLKMSITKDFFVTTGPSDQLEKLWSQVMNGESVLFECKARRPNDGTIFDVEVALKKINLDGGEVVLVNVRDITNQKAAVKMLREDEKKFRLLVENSNNLIMQFDRCYRHLYVNPKTERVFGLPLEHWIGKTAKELGSSDNQSDIVKKNIDLVFQTGKAHHVEVEDSPGQWFHCMFVPEVNDSGNVEAVVMSARDISDLKKSEYELKRRLEFEQIVTTMSSKFIGLTPESLDSAINQALASIGSFSNVDRAYVFLHRDAERRVDNTHEWCNQGVQSQIHNLQDIEIDREFPWFSEQIKKEKFVFIPEISELPPEAEKERAYFTAQKMSSVISVPMKIGHRMIGFIGFAAMQLHQDWTDNDQVLLKVVGEIFTNAIERNRVDQEQKNLQAKLSNALEMAQLGPWEYDVEKDLFTFNDQFYKMFRTTVDEIGSYTMSPADYANRFIHPDDIYMVQDEIQKSLATNDPNYNRRLEHRIRYADGFEGHIVVRFFIVKDSQGRTFKTYGVNQDITERKRAEARLRESEEKLSRSKKMESLGLLAGGVAHDLNNVLSGVVGYPDLLLMKLPKDSEFRKPIKVIQDSGKKAAAIVEDLLTIARGVASAKETLNLNTIVTKYLKSPEFIELSRYYNKVNVITDLAPNLLNIKGSIVHINKMLMNLVSNAMEAIEESGQVIINTRNLYADRPIYAYTDISVGEYSVLSVSDNGSGISKESLERIFEPFFTKKVMGKSGTGLGLAVVWNIVQDHEGTIDVKSDKNGTIFKLHFPTTRSEMPSEAHPISIDELKGNGQKILVVDDIESQREISCSMLHILGYQAEAVSSGEEAIEWVKKNKADLILLDMIMDPGISGRETYEKIIEFHPGQKAVIASGFAETDEVKETQKAGAGQFIRKPLTLERLGIVLKNEFESMHTISS